MLKLTKQKGEQMSEVLDIFKKHLQNTGLDGFNEPKEKITAQKKLAQNLAQNLTPPNKTSIHKFSQDIKGLNEFVGALQILNMAFKKISKQSEIILQEIKDAQNVDSQNLDSQNLQTLKTYIKNVVEGAKFMGNALFDVNLTSNFGGVEYEFLAQNPLPFLKNNTQEAPTNEAKIQVQNLKEYVDEKMLEARELLGILSQELNKDVSQAPRNTANAHSAHATNALSAHAAQNLQNLQNLDSQNSQNFGADFNPSQLKNLFKKI